MLGRLTSLAVLACAFVLVAAACSGASDEPASSLTQAPTGVPVESAPEPEPTANREPELNGDGLFPTVVDATATSTNGTTWQFSVTLLSEYDSPERYADAWRVLDANDLELGIRVLGHDHANEQPFTRSTSVDVPADVTAVFIEGRDQVNGWSGERFEVTLAG